MRNNVKNLQEMSLKELWQLFPIILKPHNANYAAWFEEQQKDLAAVLSDCGICRISHIGSTAVKGLIAKPIVDILLELPSSYDMNTVASLLEDNDWLVMARDGEGKTLDLNKGYTPKGFAEKVYHLHVKPVGDWGELYFRDYLRKYPDIAHEYEALKLSLKAQFEHDRDAYTQAKSDFIIKYTELARKEFAERYLTKSCS